jgi:hypothetical protein
MGQLLESFSWRLYDTAEIPAGTFQKTVLFLNPIGSRLNGKICTEADTNMICSGELPSPQRFIVHRLHLEVLSAADADLQKLKLGAIASFFICGKPYYSSPLHPLLLEEWLRSAVAKFGESAEKDLDSFLDRALENGSLALSRIGKGCWIEHKQNFKVQIEAAETLTLLQPFVFRIYLEGILFRPVC